jgi:hypothetical protein
MDPQFSFTSAPAADTATAVVPDVAQSPVMPVSDVPSTAFQPEVPVVAPQQEPDLSNVNVWAESISQSSGQGNTAIFDIVLTVSWQEGEEYKTAKIVKSVEFCKQALLSQAQNTCAAFVESKSPVAEQKKVDNSKLLRTMRELAGVPGKDNFV